MSDDDPVVNESGTPAMVKSTRISLRVDTETKRRFAAMAAISGVSESAQLKRLMIAALAQFSTNEVPEFIAGKVRYPAKLSIRLRHDDQLILRERASARGLPVATYTSLLIRSHLRQLAPLPTPELDELKRSLAAVSATERHLSQIARAINVGDPVTSPTRGDMQALLRALTALRDHFKAVINANLSSWSLGYEQATD
jgi:hypothetical protein